MPDENDGLEEIVAQFMHQLHVAIDPKKPVLPRIAQVNAAAPYLETVLRILVGQAVEKGHTWQELADVFVTTPIAVQSRFGQIRKYPGEIEDDED